MFDARYFPPFINLVVYITIEFPGLYSGGKQYRQLLYYETLQLVKQVPLIILNILCGILQLNI